VEKKKAGTRVVSRFFSPTPTKKMFQFVQPLHAVLSKSENGDLALVPTSDLLTLIPITRQKQTTINHSSSSSRCHASSSSPSNSPHSNGRRLVSPFSDGDEEEIVSITRRGSGSPYSKAIMIE